MGKSVKVLASDIMHVPYALYMCKFYIIFDIFVLFINK